MIPQASPTSAPARRSAQRLTVTEMAAYWPLVLKHRPADWYWGMSARKIILPLYIEIEAAAKALGVTPPRVETVTDWARHRRQAPTAIAIEGGKSHAVQIDRPKAPRGPKRPRATPLLRLHTAVLRAEPDATFGDLARAAEIDRAEVRPLLTDLVAQGLLVVRADGWYEDGKPVTANAARRGRS